jgi:hypothetical protein
VRRNSPWRRLKAGHYSGTCESPRDGKMKLTVQRWNMDQADCQPANDLLCSAT